MTARLDHFAACGTGGRRVAIRLTDGHRLAVETGPDSETLAYVARYGVGEVPVPDAHVPVATYQGIGAGCVRIMIGEHGGEHADQGPGAVPVRYRIGPRTAAGRYHVHLGGKEIGRIARRQGGDGDAWLAFPVDGGRDRPDFDTAEMAAQWLVERADLAAGRATTAGLDLQAALIARGLLAQWDCEVLLGGHRLTSLVLTSGGPEPEGIDCDQPHVVIFFGAADDEDEADCDRPIRPGDVWSLLLYSRAGAPRPGGRFAGEGVAQVADALAAWHRDPESAWNAAGRGGTRRLERPGC